MVNKQTSLIDVLVDPSYLQDYMFGLEYDDNTSKSGALKRGASLVFGYSLLAADGTDGIMFGKGPGSSSDTEILDGIALGSLYQLYGTLKLSRTTFSFVLIELGLVGVILVLVFLFIIYTWRGSPFESKSISVIRKMAVILMLTYFTYENLFLNLSFPLIASSLLITSSSKMIIPKPKEEEKQLEAVA
jgi:hypothetical protein